MRSFVLLVLLAVTAVGNTQNAQAEQTPKEKNDNRRGNLIHELKSLISKKSDNTKRDPHVANVEGKRNAYTIVGGYLDVKPCPEKDYESSYWYDYYYNWDSNWYDSSYYNWYDPLYYNWNDPSYYNWNDPSYYNWNDPSYYNWEDPSYYSWNDPSYYNWDDPSYYNWNDPSYYSWNDPSYYSWNDPSYYNWDDPSYYNWNDPSYYNWNDPSYYNWNDPSYYNWNDPSYYNWDEPYSPVEMYEYYDCGYNLWFDKHIGTCNFEKACGENMWYGVKRGAKRVEEKKALERMTMIRSLETTDKGKIMVGRSARPNPAEKRNRNKRIARKGHQNRALNPQHTRNMATHKRGQHGENVAKNKMAAMRARHEIPANRKMHTRNKMAGKENNENDRKIARRKLSGEKKVEANNRIAARRHMAERAKLEARKKMTGNENIAGKDNKARGMGTMNRKRNLLERLKARQLKAHEKKSEEVMETAKKAEKMV